MASVHKTLRTTDPYLQTEGITSILNRITGFSPQTLFSVVISQPWHGTRYISNSKSMAETCTDAGIRVLPGRYFYKLNAIWTDAPLCKRNILSSVPDGMGYTL